MDKLKDQLAGVMKYGFWIGSALVLLSSLVVWYMSTSSLIAETESESGRLKGKIQQISSVQSGMDEVPNEHSHAAMNQMIKKRQDEVLASWQLLYDRQKEYLTWPKEVLLEDFVEKYEGKIPIEQYITFPPERELSSNFLNRYRDHIVKEPEKLARIAGAIWTASGSSQSNRSGTFGRGASGAETPEIPVVAWSSASQADLLKEIFRWSGSTPSTLEIYYSQESQWIMKQLMLIIKEVNGDASQPYQAKIREIKEIHIGPSVNFNVGEYAPIAGGSGMSGSSASSSGSFGGASAGGAESFGRASAGSFGGRGGNNNNGTDPAEGRYIDKNLEHIAARDLRTALTSNKPADASLAVAKRVPIMMGLKMDQRYIHELLAACGSADLMVEVTHVRILGAGGSKSVTSSSRPDAGGAFSSGAGSAPAASSSRSSALTSDEYPFDVTVEIRGMIYIYNPPDPGKLPVELVTEENVGEALGETPVDRSPAAEDSTPIVDPPTPDVEELRPPADGTPPADAIENQPPGSPAADGAPAAPPADSPPTDPVPADPATAEPPPDTP